MPEKPLLDYHATSFSAGRMDFDWEELSEEEIKQAYEDWAAGKGLIGGDPRRRPNADRLPNWGINRPFFRALAMDDRRGDNGERLRALLSGTRRLEIEIGFGRADFLLDRAQRHPDDFFIGYETKTKATRLCLQRIERFGIGNVWLSDDDCRFNMPRVIPDGRIDMVHILFPDPWWKPQHLVKRLFSPPFIDLLAAKLRTGGILFFKSDVEDYTQMVQYLVTRRDCFSDHDPDLAAAVGEYAPTHREYWCMQHGRPVYSRYFVRK